jgi:hypothetical protein
VDDAVEVWELLEDSGEVGDGRLVARIGRWCAEGLGDLFAELGLDVGPFGKEVWLPKSGRPPLFRV